MRRCLIIIVAMLVTGPFVARADPGEIVVWGGTYGGYHTVHAQIPREATNIVALACGSWHTLALREDGRVLAWGVNSDGQCDVPEAASNVVAIAGNTRGSLALLKDGTILPWGFMPIPSGLAPARAIACGFYNSIAVLSNGTVATWIGTSGELFDDVPAAATNVVSASAGLSHFAALRSDGTVVAWGFGNPQPLAVPPDLTGVARIASGWDFCLALLSNGTVRAWGSTTQAVTGWTNVVAISARGDQALALTSAGQLVASGECEIPPGISNVSSISAGWEHGVAVGTVTPEMRVARKDDAIELAWPNTRRRLKLEAKSDLAGTNWVTVTNLAPLTLIPTGEVMFFRLRTP